ncbi:MAG: hypothetical protein ACRCZF_05055 [Gemmataceae bacterium]
MTRRILFVLPAILCLLAGTLVPLLFLVRLSLMEPPAGIGFYQPGTWSFAAWEASLDADLANRVLRTLLFAAGITIISATLAFTIALILWKCSAIWRILGLGALILNKIVGVLMIVLTLQTNVPRGTLAAALVEIGLIVPYLAILLTVTLRTIPDDSSIARGLGASRWQAFCRITWPRTSRTRWLALQLAWLWALGAMVGPMLVGQPRDATLAVELHRQAFEYSDWPRAAVLGVILWGLATGSWFILQNRQGRS